MDLRLKKKQDHKFITQCVRKHKDLYKELNEVNRKFDKAVFKDELDFLTFLLDSSFTLVWENGKEKGIIGTLHAFNERDVINDGEEEKLIKAYWVSIPEIVGVELVYNSFLENYFKCPIQGVKINGSTSEAKPSKKGGRSPTVTNGKHTIDPDNISPLLSPT